jgi:hypothetical protein
LFAATVPLLFGVAVFNQLYEEVGKASPFGRWGTMIIVGEVFVIACVGFVAGWRGVTGVPLAVVTGLIVVELVLMAVLEVGFLFGGHVTHGLAILLPMAGANQVCTLVRIRRPVQVARRRRREIQHG